MWVEAVGKAFTYRWRGGEVHLEPGKPVQLPDYRAMCLFSSRRGTARQVHKRALDVKKAIPKPLQPGDAISWTSAGKKHSGVIDFLHEDHAGVIWGFVTIGETWRAVNLRYVEKA